MGRDSAIEWTDHTFNPWWGCQKVSPGCANCYAEALDKRVLGVGKGHWRPGSERRLFGEKHWAEPLRWDKFAAAAGERHRVFCASMADVFEDHPGVVGARARLFGLIADTPNLDWLLLTKRPENAERLWLEARIEAFGNWTDTMTGPLWPDNVWLGTSVESQEQADIRIPKLIKIPARVRFLSMEPLLGAVDLERVGGIAPWKVDVLRGGAHDHFKGYGFVQHSDLLTINWVIVGGESGHGARPMHPGWVQSLRDQCQAAGVPFFFKQWGEWREAQDRVRSERAREFQEQGIGMFELVGKKKAGRILDGRTWDEVPR